MSAAALRLRIAFTLAALTHAAGMNIVTLLAFRYFTDNLAIAASLAGLLFMAVKIYDGVFDPLLGAWSDRTRGRYGRRLPYLLAGSLVMPACVIALFALPPGWPPLLTGIVVTAILALHASAYTALTIPGMAMVVEVTDDYHERSTLMSYRVIGNTIGMLAGSTLPAWLLARWGSTQQGHLQVAYVVAAIVLISGVLATVLLATARRTEPDQTAERLRLHHIGTQLRLAWENRPFRLLAIAHIFVLIATAVGSVSNAYFSRYVLQRSDNWLGNFYLIATIGVLVSMPAWLWLARRVGKKACYLGAMLGYGAAHLSWISADPSSTYPALVLRTALVGIASAGVILFAYSMMSDAIRFDYIRTGLRREGSYAGFTSLLDKLAAAGGMGALGAMMGAMGYRESSAAGQLMQSDSAVLAIYLGFAVIPAIAMVLGVLALLRYRLEPGDLVESQRSGAEVSPA